MKKHVFGFALFSFIFLSFAVVFALFGTTQVSTIREFKHRIVTAEEKKFCPKRTSEASAISHEVISSYFFYDENRIVSTVRISWNRTSPPPVKISVSSVFAFAGDGNNFGVSKIVENPFSESNEQIVTITTEVSEHEPISKKANLYVYTFANEHHGSKAINMPEDFTLMTPVVFVHGESSIIKN